MTSNTPCPVDAPELRALAEDTQKMLERIDALCAALQKEVRRGWEEETASRPLYADGSSSPQATPIGVLLASTGADVIRAVGLVGNHATGMMWVEASVKRRGECAREERPGVARGAAPEPKTYFRFPDDNGAFSPATLRCVNAGKPQTDRVPTHRRSDDEPTRL